MTKEELIKLIETLDIETIASLEIEYYTEKQYGFYDNREIKKIRFNNKGE